MTSLRGWLVECGAEQTETVLMTRQKLKESLNLPQMMRIHPIPSGYILLSKGKRKKEVQEKKLSTVIRATYLWTL